MCAVVVDGVPQQLTTKPAPPTRDIDITVHAAFAVPAGDELQAGNG
jgi:hypothetical protein